MNIARINTSTEAAYNAAIFAEISFSSRISSGSSDETSDSAATTVMNRHIFATLAYQSYPYKANFLSISEATQVDNGDWIDARTQNFKVNTADLDNLYLKMLDIRKKPNPVGVGNSDQLIEFTVFMTADDHLYRAEFAVAQSDSLTPNEHFFALRRADFHKSIRIKINEALTRVAFQPAYQPKSVHEWPEFYLFVTGTRLLTDEEIAAGEQQRMPDGILFSEEYLRRKVHGLELMASSKSVLELFQPSGDLVEGKTYTDSRVLPSNEQRI